MDAPFRPRRMLCPRLRHEASASAFTFFVQRVRKGEGVVVEAVGAYSAAGAAGGKGERVSVAVAVLGVIVGGLCGREYALLRVPDQLQQTTAPTMAKATTSRHSEVTDASDNITVQAKSIRKRVRASSGALHKFDLSAASNTTPAATAATAAANHKLTSRHRQAGRQQVGPESSIINCRR